MAKGKQKFKPDLPKPVPTQKNKVDGRNKRAVLDGEQAKAKERSNRSKMDSKSRRKHEVKDLNVHLDIFANALDFISNSLDPILESGSEVDVKYSVLHLHAGVELIFKEILKNEHWSLIFQKVDEADKQHLRTGNFISVNHATALTRLSSICGVNFKETELFSLEDLRRRRNIIEHYVFPVEEDPTALKTTVSEVLLTILDLIDVHFDEDEIKGHAAENLERIRKKSLEFKEFVNKKLEKIQPVLAKLADEFEIVVCPNCYQPTFVLNDAFECVFCKYTDEPEEVASNYIENVMKVSEYYEVSQGGHFPLEDCPECERHTMVLRDHDNLCFNCLQIFSTEAFDTCGRCGRLYTANEEDGTICPSCWSDIISAPD